MKRGQFALLSFIVKILTSLREIQAPALQLSLKELEGVWLIAKKLITSVTCFGGKRNKKSKIRILLPLPNQLQSSNRKIQKVLTSQILNHYKHWSRGCPLFVIENFVAQFVPLCLQVSFVVRIGVNFDRNIFHYLQPIANK